MSHSTPPDELVTGFIATTPQLADLMFELRAVDLPPEAFHRARGVPGQKEPRNAIIVPRRRKC